MKKTFCFLQVGLAAGLLVVLPAQQVTPGRDAAWTSTQSTPQGLSDGQWAGIRAAYEADRHKVAKVDGAYQARNPGQGWLTRFEDGGFVVKPDSGAWTWGLELLSYGFVGNEQAVSTPSKAQADGGRMSYRWDALLEEWYINDTRGIEHGYTVQQRPARTTDDAQRPLVFTLAVRGGLTPQVTEDQRGVRFVDAKGGTALSYTGLTVFDADGEDVPARFEQRDGLLRLLVEEADARYPLTIDPIAQQAYLKAHVVNCWDVFGYSVAICAIGLDSPGPRVVVGAPNGTLGDTGYACVFVSENGVWKQEAYLTASNPEKGDGFGHAVAICGDVVVVGAPGEDSGTGNPINGNQTNNSTAEAGAAYVFVRVNGVWQQEAYLKAKWSDVKDNLGWSVSVARRRGHTGLDGTMVAVGSPGEASNAAGINGDQRDNSLPNAGAIYVYDRIGGSWTISSYVKASNPDADDQFGITIATHQGGDPYYLETLVGGAWGEDSRATGVNGNQNDNGGALVGAAYVFERRGTTWTQQAYLKASNAESKDYFGWAVGLSDDGDTLAVSACGEASGAAGVNGDQRDNSALNAGAAYVFVRSGLTWEQQAYLKASNPDAGDCFGKALSLSGDAVLVGCGQEDSNARGINGNQSSNSAASAGAAYLFTRSGCLWSQEAYLKASNTDPGDRFGYAVSISGDLAVVGAPYEDSLATGINGWQGNHPNCVEISAGAGYLFDVSVGLGSSCLGTTFVGGFDVTLPLGGNMFDVKVKSPSGINVTSLIVNPKAGRGANVEIAVWVTSETYKGKESAMTFWTRVATGVGMSLGNGVPMNIDVGDFLLPAGDWGMAVFYMSSGLHCTLGNGSNQFYANADLELSLGVLKRQLFDPQVFSPRVWNGSICYSKPTKAAQGRYGYGCGWAGPGLTNPHTTIRLSAPPCLGSSYHILMDYPPRRPGPGWLFIGLINAVGLDLAPMGMKDCRLFTHPIALTLPLSNPGHGSHIRLPVQTPNNPALLGSMIGLQAGFDWIKAGNALGVGMTSGLAVRIGRD